MEVTLVTYPLLRPMTARGTYVVLGDADYRPIQSFRYKDVLFIHPMVPTRGVKSSGL